MNELQSHHLADIFPLIENDDFRELVADIKANGLADPIDLYQGKILDGRNRYRACVAAGIELEKHNVRHFRPELYGDPLSYVISKNLKRRHLNESQRGMIAARIARLPQGARTDLSPIGEKSQEERARIVSVGKRTVERADAVIDHGAPELQRAVERGELAVSVAAEVAKLPEAEQRRIVEPAEPHIPGKLSRRAMAEVKKVRREGREAALGARQHALPSRKFGVIVADPEWRFEPWSRSTGMDRAPDNHYPTSVASVIADRDVASIAAADCVLFLWATGPMIREGLAVMEAWGFEYKTQVIWRKSTPITGYWFRSVHELLLVGTRGHPVAPAMGTQPASVIDAPSPGAHSAKPEVFLEMIETYFPKTPKIELNRRGPARPGWSAWGNESTTDPDATEIHEDPHSSREVSSGAVPQDQAPHAGTGSETLAVCEGRIEGRGANAPAADDLDGIPDFLRREPAEAAE